MKYYCYRHIRLDKNEPFYIGIGTKPKKYDSIEKEYTRAYTKKGRSNLWEKVVEKTEYEIEILYEAETREEIEKKEIELISLYGRKYRGEGSLCNFQKGGTKMTKEIRKALSEAMGRYYEIPDNRKRRSIKTEFKNKPIYQLDENYKIIKEFSGAKEASEELGCTVSAITNTVRGRKQYGANYHWCYTDNYENKVKELKEYKLDKAEPSIIVYKEGNIIGLFEDRFEASKVLKLHSNSILGCLEGRGHHTKKYNFKYI